MRRSSSGLADLERPRVLIVALSGIGNLLMASPLFRTLKDANPRCEIDVLVVPRGTAEILEANPRIRHIRAAQPKPTMTQFWGTARRLRGERYDVGIVVHPGQLVMSALLLRAGAVRQRIGHRYSWKFLHDSGVFFTDALPLISTRGRELADRQAHDVVQNLNLLYHLGISVDLQTAAYDFPLTPADRSRADSWLIEQRLGGKTLIGVHPGSHGDLAHKRWPIDRFAELGDRLATDLSASALVFGGPDETDLTTSLCARMKAPATPVHQPLREAAALMTRCALFVSNDSGLMHVAASQHVPTFGLFGPTDERRTAPWGPRGVVIRAPGTQPTYDVASRRTPHTRVETDTSLDALTVEEAFSQLRASLLFRKVMSGLAGGRTSLRE